jgi:hypothetical protein
LIGVVPSALNAFSPPDEDGRFSTQMSFAGDVVCPACGGRASFVTGSYTMSRDGKIIEFKPPQFSLEELLSIVDTLESADDPEAAAEADPRLKQLVILAQQQGGRDWLPIVIAVLALILQAMQTAGVGSQPPASPPTTPPPRELTHEQVTEISRRVASELLRADQTAAKPDISRPNRQQRRAQQRQGRQRRPSRDHRRGQ